MAAPTMTAAAITGKFLEIEEGSFVFLGAQHVDLEAKHDFPFDSTNSPI